MSEGMFWGYANAQADLNHRRAHMSKGMFSDFEAMQMRRLIWIFAGRTSPKVCFLTEAMQMRRLIWIFAGRTCLKVCFLTLRLCKCAGWSESSQGAHVRRYVFWLWGYANVQADLNLRRAHMSEGMFSDFAAHMMSWTFSWKTGQRSFHTKMDPCKLKTQFHSLYY